MLIGWACMIPSRRNSTSVGWLIVVIRTSGATDTWSPIVTNPLSSMTRLVEHKIWVSLCLGSRLESMRFTRHLHRSLCQGLCHIHIIENGFSIIGLSTSRSKVDLSISKRMRRTTERSIPSSYISVWLYFWWWLLDFRWILSKLGAFETVRYLCRH